MFWVADKEGCLLCHCCFWIQHTRVCAFNQLISAYVCEGIQFRVHQANQSYITRHQVHLPVKAAYLRQMMPTVTQNMSRLKERSLQILRALVICLKFYHSNTSWFIKNDVIFSQVFPNLMSVQTHLTYT